MYNDILGIKKEKKGNHFDSELDEFLAAMYPVFYEEGEKLDDFILRLCKMGIKYKLYEKEKMLCHS